MGTHLVLMIFRLVRRVRSKPYVLGSFQSECGGSLNGSESLSLRELCLPDSSMKDICIVQHGGEARHCPSFVYPPVFRCGSSDWFEPWGQIPLHTQIVMTPTSTSGRKWTRL